MKQTQAPKKARLKGEVALRAVIEAEDVRTVLDIGSGRGLHAGLLRDAGKDVTTVNLYAPADYVGSYPKVGPHFSRPYDAIWASHVLEHQRNVGDFLDACVKQCRDDGILAITVPPEKSQLVGGHLTTWTAGRLVYNLILAGLDCSKAKVWRYGYNVSVVVRKRVVSLPTLVMDNGDIEALAHLFPFPVEQGCSGWRVTEEVVEATSGDATWVVQGIR